jgi:hypothetical protein
MKSEIFGSGDVFLQTLEERGVAREVLKAMGQDEVADALAEACDTQVEEDFRLASPHSFDLIKGLRRVVLGQAEIDPKYHGIATTMLGDFDGRDRRGRVKVGGRRLVQKVIKGRRSGEGLGWAFSDQS